MRCAGAGSTISLPASSITRTSACAASANAATNAASLFISTRHEDRLAFDVHTAQRMPEGRRERRLVEHARYRPRGERSIAAVKHRVRAEAGSQVDIVQ